MTICEHRLLRISIVTLGLVVTGAVCADRVMAQTCSAASDPSCVSITFNVNLQLTKLHPAVTDVNVACTPTGAQTFRAPSNKEPVVNRGYTGTVTAIMKVQRSYLAIPANRTVKITCNLYLWNGNTNNWALATAAQPEGITNANWAVVATGSTVNWTQDVTFPNVP